MVGEGTPKSTALSRLTSRGLAQPSGSRVSAQLFSKMLANPIYAGRIVIEPWSLDVQGDFEAIVTPEEFQTAQIVGKNRSASPHHVLDHPDFPLRRTVRCGVCDAPLTASWSRGRGGRYGYYRCPRKGCGKTSIRRDRLEATFEDFLSQRSARPEVLSLMGAVVQDAVRSANRRLQAARTSLAERRADLLAKQTRLVEAYLYEQTVDKAVYESEMVRLRDALTSIEVELAELSEDIVDAASTFERASAVLSDLRTCWRSIAPEAKPQFLEATFPSGLTCAEGTIGTRERSWLFDVFASEQPGAVTLAARTGFEPVPPP